MPKVKLTKNELKKQKDDLRRFNRYLPLLKLKKQQLQAEIEKIHHVIAQDLKQLQNLEEQIFLWVDVFAESVDIRKLLVLKQILTRIGNIAGIDIPLYQDVEFQEIPYDFLFTPLWVDKAIEICKEVIALEAKIEIASKAADILQEELRITVQRVNLFEKIKIPQSAESIRVINIFLGDLQTAEVVRGKIAKTKIEKKKEALAI